MRNLSVRCGCFSVSAGIAPNVLQIGNRFNVANVLLALVALRGI